VDQKWRTRSQTSRKSEGYVEEVCDVKRYATISQTKQRSFVSSSVLEAPAEFLTEAGKIRTVNKLNSDVTDDGYSWSVDSSNERNGRRKRN
jgi:hypothetical protein